MKNLATSIAAIFLAATVSGAVVTTAAETNTDSRAMNVTQSLHYINTSYKESCKVFREYGFDFEEPLKPFMAGVNAIAEPIAQLADAFNLFDAGNYEE